MQEIITSRENPKIKKIIRLLSSKKERDAQSLFVAEGARLCVDAVDAGITIEELYITHKSSEKYGELLGEVFVNAKEAFYISEDIAAKISDTVSSQGVFTVCQKNNNDFSSIRIKSKGNYLLLDNLQDPGNVGTILRTCGALGIDAVFLYNSVDIYSPKVLRSAMGGIFRLPLIITEDLSLAIDFIKQKSLKVWAAALGKSSEKLDNTLFENGGAVIIGNEGSGISKERISECDGTITIPMFKGSDSLNAAAAASIILWEMTKGR